MQFNFDELTGKLNDRLSKPLPGKIAHQLMMAHSRYNLEIKPNKDTKSSAVLLLFYPHQNDIYLPMILRPPYDGAHGGQAAFPGGKVEKYDENLERTALREAQEEIGIKTSEVTILGRLSEVYIPVSNFLVQPILGFTYQKPDFYPDPIEVSSIFEITLSELINPNIITTEVLNVRGVEVNAPIFNLANTKVWGASAMIIAELNMILEQL